VDVVEVTALVEVPLTSFTAPWSTETAPLKVLMPTEMVHVAEEAVVVVVVVAVTMVLMALMVSKGQALHRNKCTVMFHHPLALTNPGAEAEVVDVAEEDVAALIAVEVMGELVMELKARCLAAMYLAGSDG
jgi:hypothetical protein